MTYAASFARSNCTFSPSIGMCQYFWSRQEWVKVSVEKISLRRCSSMRVARVDIISGAALMRECRDRRMFTPGAGRFFSLRFYRGSRPAAGCFLVAPWWCPHSALPVRRWLLPSAGGRKVRGGRADDPQPLRAGDRRNIGSVDHDLVECELSGDDSARAARGIDYPLRSHDQSMAQTARMVQIWFRGQER